MVPRPQLACPKENISICGAAFRQIQGGLCELGQLTRAIAHLRTGCAESRGAVVQPLMDTG